MKTDRPVATGEAPAASPEKDRGWMVKWPPPAAHLQTQQVFETEREAHEWVRMNVASWTRDIGYEVCPVFTEPTPNSAAEEVRYEVKHLEPLRCQEYEDEISALRQTLGGIMGQLEWMRKTDPRLQRLYHTACTALAKRD